MAAVYRAFDRQDEGWVAVKLLLPQFGDRPNIRARFEAEARAMSGLRHRNVIAVTDVSTDGELPFFVMELAEGGCLVDWVERHGPMPARMATDVTIQICKGLGAAHRAGVIHRDIKPHNILVNRRGTCKITDFGIAQYSEENASLTKTGSVMGTLGFIAPEQRSNAKSVDERSDLYSVGATLYTLLTARTTMDLFFADQEPEILEGVPAGLIPVITRATRYRREDRYSSVRAMAKALYHAKAALPDDPPDTPNLVMHQSRYESEEADPFTDEVTGSLSGLRTPSTTGSDSRVIFATPPGTDSDARLQDTPPEIPQALASASIDVSMSGSTISRTAAPRTATTPTRAALLGSKSTQRRRQPVDWGALSLRAAVVALPFVALITLGGVLLSVGNSAVDLQERRALEALDTWFAAVGKESALVSELEELGADTRELGVAYARLSGIDDPYARAAATLDYQELAAELVGQHAPQHAGSSTSSLHNQARQRLGGLESQRNAYLRAVTAWNAAASSPTGRAAVSVGLANAPPAAVTP